MANINDIPLKHLISGIAGRYVHGDQCTMGIVEIEKGSVLPLHHHPHEQLTYILEGELEMTIGGETINLRQGDYFVIHSNVPHSAVANVACKVMDVFAPVREEYK
jgi:quercetin dioxygenase-like cupin family protein